MVLFWQKHFEPPWQPWTRTSLTGRAPSCLWEEIKTPWGNPHDAGEEWTRLISWITADAQRQQKPTGEEIHRHRSEKQQKIIHLLTGWWRWRQLNIHRKPFNIQTCTAWTSHTTWGNNEYLSLFYLNAFTLKYNNKYSLCLVSKCCRRSTTLRGLDLFDLNTENTTMRGC